MTQGKDGSIMITKVKNKLFKIWKEKMEIFEDS